VLLNKSVDITVAPLDLIVTYIHVNHWKWPLFQYRTAPLTVKKLLNKKAGRDPYTPIPRNVTWKMSEQ